MTVPIIGSAKTAYVDGSRLLWALPSLVHGRFGYRAIAPDRIQGDAVLLPHAFLGTSISVPLAGSYLPETVNFRLPRRRAGDPSPATISPLRFRRQRNGPTRGGFFLYVIEILQTSGRLRPPGFKDPTTRITTPPSDHIPLGGVVR